MQAEGLEHYELSTKDLSVSIRKGERYDLEPHLAIVLASRGIVTVELLTGANIRKKGMEERASAQLTQLPEDYFEHIAYSIESTTDEKERERMRMAGRELAMLRLEKLTRLASQSKKPKAKLTLMEQAFFLQQEHLFRDTLNGILRHETTSKEK
jgi:hypothetical protein